MTLPPSPADDLPPEDEGTQTLNEPRRWREGRWTAQVLKNDSDDGWAVAMVLEGQAEPALVGPWTMGRDKKNPKPLDGNAFRTLVKTASEVLRRHEQHVQATLHKQITVSLESGRVTVALDIVPEDDHPTATLSAQDEAGEELARIPVSPAFRLDRASALNWVEGGFQRLR